MKILIVSDSHRVLFPILEIMEVISKNIDMVIHLGDCSDDIQDIERIYKGITFHYVNGNCDFNETVGNEKIILANGKKIWISHGHEYNVKMGYDRISYAAEEKEVDICLFGHTHMPVNFYYNRILFMNPGSVFQPRGISVPSYGIIDISHKGEIESQIVGIYGNKIYRPLDNI